MDVIYGKTGFSFFDVWALVHFCFWVFAGSCVWAWGKKSVSLWWRAEAIFGCLIFAFLWEVAEYLLAPRNHQLWGDWFLYEGFKFQALCGDWFEKCHYESWWNSWVSDPLTCLVGVLMIFSLLDNTRRA